MLPSVVYHYRFINEYLNKIISQRTPEMLNIWKGERDYRIARFMHELVYDTRNGFGWFESPRTGVPLPHRLKLESPNQVKFSKQLEFFIHFYQDIWYWRLYNNEFVHKPNYRKDNIKGIFEFIMDMVNGEPRKFT